MDVYAAEQQAFSQGIVAWSTRKPVTRWVLPIAWEERLCCGWCQPVKSFPLLNQPKLQVYIGGTRKRSWSTGSSCVSLPRCGDQESLSSLLPPEGPDGGFPDKGTQIRQMFIGSVLCKNWAVSYTPQW